MTSIGVGLVGYKFMGRAHSNAYRQMAAFFPDVPRPCMAAICGRDEAAVARAADQLGWDGFETDYDALIARDDIDLIDVSTPGYLHHDVVLAALAAGKHVFCEKPLANSLPEAAAMVRAWQAAGTVGMINFNYRRVPAIELAKRLIDDGRIGDIRHFRAAYLQDWLVNPDAPLSWRLQQEYAGTGALGDIAAHITDLAHLLVGPIAHVVGTLTTFVHDRPIEGAPAGERGPVTVDDATSFLARFESGATGVFEASRVAAGRRNANVLEINGTEGSLRFDLERMNELEVYLVDDAPDMQGFRRVLVTDADHPSAPNWWPAGHILGWEHTHVHQVATLLGGIATGGHPAPSFLDGFACQAVLDAVQRSATSGQWERPRTLDELPG